MSMDKLVISGGPAALTTGTFSGLLTAQAGLTVSGGSLTMDGRIVGNLSIGGGAKDLVLRAGDATSLIRFQNAAQSATTASINGETGAVSMGALTATTINASGLLTASGITVGGTLTIGANYAEFTAMTAPASPSLSRGRLFIYDNGTNWALAIKWSDGSIDEIAVGPAS